MKPFFLTPEEGARTAVFLATDDSVSNITGGYFYRCKITKPAKQAKDPVAAKRLFELSEELTGCRFT